MNDELPKGTRVEITDTGHVNFGLEVEIKYYTLGGQWAVKVGTEVDYLATSQFKVLVKPEPSIGPLVGAMHDEINRIRLEKKWGVVSLVIDLRPGLVSDVSRFNVHVEFFESDPIHARGETPRAALEEMIKQLRALR